MSRKFLPLVVAAAFLAGSAQAEVIEPAIADTQESNPIDENSKKKSKVRARLLVESQGAGTPNQIGAGLFVPVYESDRNLLFFDVQAGVNLPDVSDYSSIVTTLVEGGTVSTSTRLGYRWLANDRSIMYGINAGYDSRPMNSGQTEDNIPLLGTEQTVFYQQIGVNAEVATRNFDVNAYALLPIGKKEQMLNWYAAGGALNTYGLDLKFKALDRLSGSIGYYYQHGDLGAADGSGIKGKVVFDMSDDVSFVVKGTYDEAFETRVSGNIVYRFSGSPVGVKNVSSDLMGAFNSVPGNRTVRIHDCHWYDPVCDVESAVHWADQNVIRPMREGLQDLGMSAKQAGEFMDKLERKLGEKIAKWAFKKVVKKIWESRGELKKLGEEDTEPLRNYAEDLEIGYDMNGMDGVAGVVVDNPELTVEALGDVVEIAAE